MMRPALVAALFAGLLIAEEAVAATEQPRPLVVIDPGHGGLELGAVGRSGVREKDVALAIALAMARELSQDSTLEVRLTRDNDVDVPLWLRGEQATVWKGDRPGLFISIHANALPGRPATAGFETYFLSSARDEDERRVAAIENAGARAPDPSSGAADQDPLLGRILTDLITLEHQHWSADLANEVQVQLARIHPGPDRGVKQGPFAVITNAIMPSVLVEIGFLTSPSEERLLSLPEFQRDAGRALAAAARAFLARYVPGRGVPPPGQGG